jgi:hypothetical protein
MHGTYGYSAESLQLVETISPRVRQSIISGRDANLAAMPYYSGPCNDSTDEINTTRHDPRLKRILSLGEFIQAFWYIQKYNMLSISKPKK